MVQNLKSVWSLYWVGYFSTFKPNSKKDHTVESEIKLEGQLPSLVYERTSYKLYIQNIRDEAAPQLNIKSFSELLSSQQEHVSDIDHFTSQDWSSHSQKPSHLHSPQSFRGYDRVAVSMVWFTPSNSPLALRLSPWLIKANENLLPLLKLLSPPQPFNNSKEQIFLIHPSRLLLADPSQVKFTLSNYQQEPWSS